MPPIYIGETPLIKRYIGDTEVTKVYIGVQEVYSSGAALVQPAQFGAVVRQMNRINSLNLGTNAGLGRYTDVQFNGLAAFTGVRLVHANYNTAAAMVINRSIVAVTGVSFNNGNTLSWSADVTWSGVSNVSIPAATTGAGGGVIPSYAVSDPITIASVARSDGGTLPILRVRTHHNDSSVVNSPASADVTATNAASFNPGFTYGSASGPTTVAALGTVSATPAAVGGVMNPVSVSFDYADAEYSVAAFGDSLSQAVGSTGSTNGWPQRLMFAAMVAGVRLSVANFAASGRKHEDYVADATAFVTAHKPSMAAIFAWSVNSGITQGAFDACWARTEAFIAHCQANSVVPVIVTSPPSQGTTWSLIAAQNVKVMALADTVIKVDAATLLGDGQPTPALQAQYNNGDGVHWSELASGDVGALALIAIQAKM